MLKSGLKKACVAVHGQFFLGVHIGVIWGFPKIRGTILGVPITRTIVFWGLYWGPLILVNYHIGIMEKKLETTMLYKDYIGIILGVI